MFYKRALNTKLYRNVSGIRSFAICTFHESSDITGTEETGHKGAGCLRGWESGGPKVKERQRIERLAWGQRCPLVAGRACPWPALDSFCPLHCISLGRASDNSLRNSEILPNQSWFHFWKNNIRGPLKTFTILSPVTMESGASHQLAILCLNCLCLFYSLDLSTPGQIFLLPIFELAGFSEATVQ